MLVPVLVLVVTLLVTRALWYRWKYDLHKIPSPPSLPLIGHTHEFTFGQAGKQMTQWLDRHLKKLGYPKIITISLLGKTWVIVMDTEFIKTTMLAKTQPFPKITEGVGFIMPIIGNDPKAKCMLMTRMPTPYVKAVRKIHLTGLMTSSLKRGMPKLNEMFLKMVKAIESERENGAIDFQERFVKLTLDVIGIVAFDSNFGGMDGSRPLYDLLMEVGHIARGRFYNPLKAIYCSLFPNSKLAQYEVGTIDKLTAEWTKLADETYEHEDPPPGEKEPPIWHGLRTLVDPETGKLIGRNTLRAEIAVLVTAGMDTTGHQLAWTFAVLAERPDVVKKILDELEQHGLYGPNAKEVTFDDLAGLEYLTAMLKESLRMLHILPSTFLRMVPRDMTILGYKVPKGTPITCPGNRAYSIEAEWGDPRVFRPERWLSGEDHSEKYNMPFSVGSRDCIGQRLSWLEMRLAVIKLLTRYDFKLKGTFEDLIRDSKDGVAIEAIGGINLYVTPRA